LFAQMTEAQRTIWAAPVARGDQQIADAVAVIPPYLQVENSLMIPSNLYSDCRELLRERHPSVWETFKEVNAGAQSRPKRGRERRSQATSYRHPQGNDGP
jgi:hypothetical protein